MAFRNSRSKALSCISVPETPPLSNPRLCRSSSQRSIVFRSDSFATSERSLVFNPAAAATKEECLKVFKFEDLSQATGSFCFESHVGGGRINAFKGILGGKAFAIVIDHDSCDIQLLEKINSPYIVKLVGYCEQPEQNKRLLVYDFVPNGFLKWHLSSFVVMPWTTRRKIAIGISRGLKYLHTDTGLGMVLHGNLSSQNILLTHNFYPLIEGLGYLVQGEKSLNYLPMRPGYTAPECMNGEAFTEKADIYSLGVIFLELITGRKAYDPSKQRGQQLLVEWARPLMKNYDTHGLVDPRMTDQYNHYELFSLMNAASFCLKRDPSSRPSILMVLTMLDDEEPDAQDPSFSSIGTSDSSTVSPSSSAAHQSPLKPTCSARTVGLSYGDMLV